jgi:hypothetical protein
MYQGEEDVVHILLNSTVRRYWGKQLLYKKESLMNNKLSCNKIIIRTTTIHFRDRGK